MTQETAFNSGFDYTSFVNDGFDSQTKYAKAAGDKWTPDNLRNVDNLIAIGGEETKESFNDAIQFRYQKIIEHFGHLIEEAIEARVYVPRRSWKNGERSYLDDPAMRREFCYELFDILLFHRAILAYAGISGEEFAMFAAEKSGYNKTRPDHNVNGTEAAVENPAAELQGECPSAVFNH